MTDRERNRKKLIIWLKLYAGQFPKTGGMINLAEFGKPTACVPIPDWICDRWSDEGVRATDLHLARLLDELRRTHFHLFEKLWVVHLSEGSSIGILDRWEKRETPLDRVMIDLYERAIRWILDRLEESGFGLTIGVTKEDEPVTSMHQASMNEASARKARERQEVAEWFYSLGEDVPRMERYERTGKRFSVHPDTVRTALRFVESKADY